MALDFAILGEDGTPQEQVPIGVNVHHRLMQRVRPETEPLLQRAADFYADTEFTASEVPTLLREVERLLDRCGGDDELVAFLRALGALASKASGTKAPITVIAD